MNLAGPFFLTGAVTWVFIPVSIGALVGVATALTGGFHWALWVCGLVGLTAVPVALLLVRRTEIAQAAAATTPRKAPAPAPAD